jgi:signal transduction histidine kinase
MNLHDASELAAIAGGVTVVGFVVGAVALRVLRSRSMGAQIGALTCSSIVAVLAGAYAASRAMFISPHDLTALTVVLIAAGTVAIAGGFVLGARVGGASRALVVATRRIGDDDDTDTGGRLERRPPIELVELASELAATRDRLAEARERQQALEGSRRELVAWVSHDLRTPLAGMRAIVEALEDRIVDDPATVERSIISRAWWMTSSS